MILESTYTVKVANAEENLNINNFRWFRILSMPTGAVVQVQTNQLNKISPYITLAPLSDWVDLKEPCTVARIQSTVVGPVVYQYSLDDKIHSTAGGSGGGGGGPFLNVKIPDQIISAPTTFSVPDGMATLRLAINGLGSGESVIALDRSNNYIRQLLFNDGNGMMYRSIQQGLQSYGSTFYLDVAGMDEIQIIGTGGSVQIAGTFSTAPLDVPPKSLTLWATDLGITLGQVITGTPVDLASQWLPGVTSIDVTVQATPVVGAVMVMVLYPVGGLNQDASVGNQGCGLPFPTVPATSTAQSFNYYHWDRKPAESLAVSGAAFGYNSVATPAAGFPRLTEPGAD